MWGKELLGIIKEEFGMDFKIEPWSHYKEGCCPSCEPGGPWRTYDVSYNSKYLTFFAEMKLVQIGSVRYALPEEFKGEFDGFLVSRKGFASMERWNEDLIKKLHEEYEKRKDVRAIRRKMKPVEEKSMIEKFVLMANLQSQLPPHPVNHTRQFQGVLVDSLSDREMLSAEVVSLYGEYDLSKSIGYSLEKFDHPVDQEKLKSLLEGRKVFATIINSRGYCLRDSESYAKYTRSFGRRQEREEEKNVFAVRVDVVEDTVGVRAAVNELIGVGKEFEDYFKSRKK